MTKIDFEKILIEFLNSPFNRQFDEKLKSALKEQGLEYKNGEIVKTQRRVAAEAKEAIFNDEDERIREHIVTFLLEADKMGDAPSEVAEWFAWLEQQKEYISTDFNYVWERTDCGSLTSSLDKYSEEAIKKVCHAWYDKGIELERKSWLKKHTYTQKDVDDAYLKGVTDTKNELEKQGDQDNNEDVDVLQRFSFYSYKDEPNVLYLSGLYVNDEYRNKGIGTKILKIANKVSTMMKCNYIRLKAESGSDAERLYKENGYNTLKKEGNQVWLEKQGNKESIWHNEDEEPQRDSLILLIMQSGTPIVAKIIEPNHTFNHGERWAYIDDLLEKQGEHSISDVPSREVILAIWQLGNDWKELTDGVICTEYGTQLDYIQKHWQESEYYLRSKQGK